MKKSVFVSVSAILTLFLAPGCDDLGVDVPRTPADAVRFDPDTLSSWGFDPTSYRKWWHEVEICAKTARNFDEIRWYVVPDAQSISVMLPNGQVAHGAGMYDAITGDQITIIRPDLYDASLVRHEMLHAILKTPKHDGKWREAYDSNPQLFSPPING